MRKPTLSKILDAVSQAKTALFCRKNLVTPTIETGALVQEYVTFDERIARLRKVYHTDTKPYYAHPNPTFGFGVTETAPKKSTTLGSEPTRSAPTTAPDLATGFIANFMGGMN